MLHFLPGSRVWVDNPGARLGSLRPCIAIRYPYYPFLPTMESDFVRATTLFILPCFVHYQISACHATSQAPRLCFPAFKLSAKLDTTKDPCLKEIQPTSA